MQVLNIHIFSPIKIQSMFIIRYMNRPFVTWKCDEMSGEDRGTEKEQQVRRI